MTRPLRMGVYGLVWLLLAWPGTVRSADERDAVITKLQERLEALEKRLADLESRLPQTADAGSTENTVKAQVIAARKRMQKDRTKYSQAQLAEAEQLYQVANKNWRSRQAKTNLEDMIKKYPDLNRTGCAVLYLAQWAKGAERERLLRDAIDKYGDCYYGDGAQVGPLARFLLALDYQEAGEKDKARALVDELRKDFPQSIDHQGNLLAGQFPST